MTSPSDVSVVPLAKACEVLGVSRQRRDGWVKDKLILGDTKGRTSLSEVLDCAAFIALVGALGFDDARIAWMQVRDACRANRDGVRLDVVVDLQYKETFLATSDDAIGEKVRHGRPVKVVAIGDRLNEVRAAFALVEAGLGRAAKSRS